jgi:hypothetical protein
MSTDDPQEQAARKLLSGRDCIKAKAHGLTPVQAARKCYGDNALEAVEVALKDDQVAVTDDLLATVRKDTSSTIGADADDVDTTSLSTSWRRACSRGRSTVAMTPRATGTANTCWSVRRATTASRGRVRF